MPIPKYDEIMLPLLKALSDGKEHPKAAELVGKPRPTDQGELGRLLKDAYGVRDAGTMTSCSMCHR